MSGLCDELNNTPISQNIKPMTDKAKIIDDLVKTLSMKNLGPDIQVYTVHLSTAVEQEHLLLPMMVMAP